MTTPSRSNSAIAAGLDCEHVEVRGDGHHWEALIVSARFEGLPRVAPAPARLRGARRADARGDPRAVDDDAHAGPVGDRAQRRLTWTGSSSTAAARLAGEVRISGAKNAALPILCASLLRAEPLVAHQRAALERRARRCGRCSRRWACGATRATTATRRARRVVASTGRSRPTSSSRRCARRPRARAAASRATAGRASRCRAAARSARGRSTSTSRACEAMGAEIDLEHGYVGARAKRLARRALRLRHGRPSPAPRT